MNMMGGKTVWWNDNVQMHVSVCSPLCIHTGSTISMKCFSSTSLHSLNVQHFANTKWCFFNLCWVRKNTLLMSSPISRIGPLSVKTVGEGDEHPCPPQHLCKEALVLRPCLCSADSTGPSHTALERLSRASHAQKRAQSQGPRQPHAPYSYQLIKLDNNPVFLSRACLNALVAASPTFKTGTREPCYSSSERWRGRVQSGWVHHYVRLMHCSPRLQYNSDTMCHPAPHCKIKGWLYVRAAEPRLSSPPPSTVHHKQHPDWQPAKTRPVRANCRRTRRRLIRLWVHACLRDIFNVVRVENENTSSLRNVPSTLFKRWNVRESAASPLTITAVNESVIKSLVSFHQLAAAHIFNSGIRLQLIPSVINANASSPRRKVLLPQSVVTRSALFLFNARWASLPDRIFILLHSNGSTFDLSKCLS